MWDLQTKMKPHTEIHICDKDAETLYTVPQIHTKQNINYPRTIYIMKAPSLTFSWSNHPVEGKLKVIA